MTAKSAAALPLKRVKAHTRYHTADGQRVPGATTITGVLNKPALVKWANNLGLDGIDVTEYVDVLASVGTLVHDMILADVNGTQVDTNTFTGEQIELAENAFLSYCNWRNAHEVVPVLVEQPLVSEDHQFGGTPDLLAYVDGVLELVDYKSGSGIFAEHLHQVAGGYRLLVNEHGYKPERVRIVRIPRTEDEAFEEHVVTDCGPHIELFLHCRAIYELQASMKKRHFPKKQGGEQ